MAWMFTLRGDLKTRTRLILELCGVAIIIAIWVIITTGENPIVRSGILPRPLKVLNAYGDLYKDNSLIQNSFKSLGLNIAGYAKALMLTIPLGFIIGLYPLFRGLFKRHIDAVRFIPLTAVTSLFIVWFGIGTSMKVNFLAFGILIFLLPIIVQRIDEVEDVYLKTVYTIGASDWQTIRTVYFPSDMSRLFDDIRVLTAISWTYIIVAEGIGSQGGLGALIFRVGQRQGRVDKTFAVLLLIILIGIIQDRIFMRMDKEFFPHKYQVRDAHKHSKLDKPSVWDTVMEFAFTAMTWIILALYIVLAINEVAGFLNNIKIMDYLFGDTQWVIHLIFLSMIFYKVRKFWMNRARRLDHLKAQPSDVSG